jgi:transcription termination factor Rho
VLADASDEGEAERAVITTESALITLDPELAAAGVHPALVTAECRVSNEEDIREADELAAVRRLREALAGLDGAEAARFLRERIEGTSSNADVLATF